MDKRRKVHLCGFCRRRKIKCDRRQPCSSCVKFKKVCTFEEIVGEERKLTPPPPRKEVMESKKEASVDREVREEIYRLANKIELLEKVVGAGDGELMDFKYLSDKNNLNPPLVARHSGPFSWVNTIKYDPVLSRLWWDSEEKVDQVINSVPGLDPKTGPIVSPVTNHVLDHMTTFFNYNSYSIPGPILRPTRVVGNEEDAMKSKFDLIRKIEALLPRPEAIEAILNIFFHTLYYCFPFVVEADYRAKLKELMNDDGTLNVQSKDGFAYLGILLIISKLVHVTILFDDFSLRSTFNDTLAILKTTPIDIRFIDVAQLCLNQFNLITSITVPVFQLLAFIKTYQTYGPEFGEGCDEGEGQIFTSLLLQAAYSLGIHREPTQGNDEHKDCLRRLWYYSVMSDYNCFFTNGDVLNVHKFYSQVSLPPDRVIEELKEELPKWDEIYDLLKGPFSIEDVTLVVAKVTYEPHTDIYVDTFRFQHHLDVIHLSISTYFHLFNHGICFKSLQSCFQVIYHDFWPIMGLTGKIKLLLVPIMTSICQKILHINVSVSSRTSDNHLRSLLTRSSGFILGLLRYLATEYYFSWKVLKVTERLGIVATEHGGMGDHRLSPQEDATLSGILERTLDNAVSFPDHGLNDVKWLAIQGFKHNRAYTEDEYFESLER